MTAADDEFVAFVEEISADLRRTTKRLAPAGVDADDLAADALARVYANWSRLATLEYRRAWVFKVVSNLALSAHSSGRRRAMSLRRWAPDEVANRSGGSEHEVDERLEVRALLRHLPRRQREALALHYVADLSIEQTAEVMGVTRETAKTHVQRGLDSIRSRIESPPEELLHG